MAHQVWQHLACRTDGTSRSSPWRLSDRKLPLWEIHSFVVLWVELQKSTRDPDGQRFMLVLVKSWIFSACPLHTEVQRLVSGGWLDSLKAGFPLSPHKPFIPNYIWDTAPVMCLWGSAALCSLPYLNSAHTITQQRHLTAFKLRAFDLALDQFSALSKPISQSQPLTLVSGNIEGHWQYHWTQIMCECEHLDKTGTAWPTDSQYKQQAESSDVLEPLCAARPARSHTVELVFYWDTHIIPSPITLIQVQVEGVAVLIQDLTSRSVCRATAQCTFVLGNFIFMFYLVIIIVCCILLYTDTVREQRWSRKFCRDMKLWQSRHPGGSDQTTYHQDDDLSNHRPSSWIVYFSVKMSHQRHEAEDWLIKLSVRSVHKLWMLWILRIILQTFHFSTWTQGNQFMLFHKNIQINWNFFFC